MVPPIPGAELGITSDGFFELEERPQRVAVIGSGYISIELAGIFAALGSKTTLLLRGEAALKEFDAMIGQATLKIFRETGVDVVTNARRDRSSAMPMARSSSTLRDDRRLRPFDCVLWAIGRSRR